MGKTVKTAAPLSPASPVTRLKGVGEARAAALQKLGIRTVGDLLRHFPRAYENRGDIKTLAEGTDGVCAAFLLTVQTTPRIARPRRGMTLTTMRASDASGTAEIVFFNQEYVAGQLHAGQLYRFWGRLQYKRGRYQLSTPAFDAVLPDIVLPDLVPRYPVCENLSQKVLHNTIMDALAAVQADLADPLPEEIRLSEHFPTLATALKEIHDPTGKAALQAALRRMMYEELFCMAIGIARSKRENTELRLPVYRKTDMAPFCDALPFSMTGAQKRSVDEILRDMSCAGADGKTAAMRRILIGDVGSGKTVCAEAAAYLSALNGKQTALMVPTAVLAAQHYKECKPLFEKLGYCTELLTGSTPLKEKKQIYARLRGEGPRIDLLIGTHALLQEQVAFEDLGLIITDEQHRFGVAQRATLRGKSEGCHLLVMSATPIPRTLALSMYGDLSVSRLDEMPPGRQIIDTYKVDESYRNRLNAFIRKNVAGGGQVYVVCPSIEQSDDDEGIVEEVEMSDLFRTARETRPPLKNAVQYAEDLRAACPDLRVLLLHGRMKTQEKEAVMQAFSRGEADVLVSTTVIEVGVNVPNATLMIVENAERFGLSQLHQLRGRVGRGKKKSYCILVSDSKGEAAAERLSVMCKCHDGYRIAEQDLLMRGPGDFFAAIDTGNVRQSGGLSLRLASACDDADLMKRAFSAAGDLVRSDPTLSLPCHLVLKGEIERIFTLDEQTVS